MLIDRRLDIHGLECNAVGFPPVFLRCPLVRAVVPKHGMVTARMPFAVEFEHIECVYEHDKRKRGIQSAG